MTDSTVLPFIRVVAAGVHLNTAGKKRLRLVLVATPALSPVTGFELEAWPGRMLASVATGVSIKILQTPAPGPVAWPPDARWRSFTATPMASRPTPADMREIGRLWQSALNVGPGSWVSLAKDIDASLKAHKQKANLLASQPSDPQKLGPEGELPVPPPRPGDVASIEGVIPMAQTALAIEAETVRAARVFAIMQKGPFTLDRKVIPADRNIAKEGDLKDARQEAFQAASDAVQPARNCSKAHFDKVQTALKGGTPEWTPVTGTPLVPEPELVRHGREKCALQASHAYGTTLQRTTPPTKPDQSGPVPTPGAASSAPPEPTPEYLGHLRARFYAIQGDPMLSRLFGLCADLDFDPGDLREGYLHIAAELHGTGSMATDRPCVITAARWDGNSFWPCSMFDADAMVATAGNLVATGGKHVVPQRHGVWCMAGAATQPGRFELASLDVRSATEQARARPGMHGTSAGDKGEQHRTAGFTILDRQRADETARDLAIAAIQTNAVKSCGVVVLHAEELTIGRRVDIAAADPAATIASIRWRSLMGRIVALDFPAHPGAAAALRKLMPPGKDGLWLEHGSFQTGARLLPKLAPPDGNQVPCEALVEEAIFTWDGTPAGALTDPGPRSEDKQALPWRRSHRPPLAEDGKNLRPVPLRYGVPYLFGFTSVFLGGIAPSVQDAAAVRATARTTMLPNPGVHATLGQEPAQPRRFLRHESIGPPLLMFSKEFALREHGVSGVLGFEPLDAAILRTARDATSKPDVPSPHPPARDRAGPDVTQRVFLPPEMALDAVARHGMLDTKPDQVLRGGLLDVTFRPRLPCRAGRTQVAQAFPAVITVAKPGLDEEPAALRREVTLGTSSDIGMPLFEPGPNTVGPRQPGYLPDPAAEIYCLRARISGSDRYLESSLQIPVFAPDHAYPDALPLVVELHKTQKVRPHPATHINNLCASPAQRARMLPGGALVAANAKSGQPVWLLRLALAPGEDFDLEVTCLPTDETLACWFAVVETMAAQWRAVECDLDAKKRLTCLAGPPPRLPAHSGAKFATICEQVVDSAAIFEVASQLGRTMRECWPIQDIAASAKLRITHAVNLPNAEPGLHDPATRRPKTPPADSSVDWPTGDAPGSTTMLLQGTLLLDLEQVSGVELVAFTIPIAGDIDDLGRTRSRGMRRSGRWPVTLDGNGQPVPEDVQTVLSFDVDLDGKVTLPQEHVQLLRIDNLPTHHAVPEARPFGPQQGRMTAIELGILHENAIRGTPIAIPVGAPAGQVDGVSRTRSVRAVQHQVLTGTRARRLLLQVVTIGRHAAAFETAPRFVPTGTPLYRRRLPLADYEQSQTWPPQDRDGPPKGWPVWVKATERPPPPDALRPELSFQMDRHSEPLGRGQSHRLTRTTQVRLWFRRGWFGSGEGERLGIVLWPPNYQISVLPETDEKMVRFKGRDISVADLDDMDLGPGGGFVTRWGGDPIRGEATPQKGMLIPPSAFGVEPGIESQPHDPRWVPEVLMPRSADPDIDGSGTETVSTADYRLMPVTLLTFEPYFDLDREQWFVDVPLRPNRATEPLVRFGLVRYQEQAVHESLCVSRPIAVMAFLLPPRTMTAEIWMDGAEIRASVTVEGAGSLEQALPDWQQVPPDKDQAARALWEAEARTAVAKAARPVMRLSLFHEHEDSGGRLHRHRMKPDEDVGSMKRDVSNGLLLWQVSDLTITPAQRRELGRGQYVCMVEEVDRRMMATYPDEPIEISAMFKTDGFIDSGPRFEGRIVLFDDPGL